MCLCVNVTHTPPPPPSLSTTATITNEDLCLERRVLNKSLGYPDTKPSDISFVDRNNALCLANAQSCYSVEK